MGDRSGRARASIRTPRLDLRRCRPCDRTDLGGRSRAANTAQDRRALCRAGGQEHGRDRYRVATAYFEQIKPNNPHSPTAVYGKDGQVDVAVNAIAFLGKGVAQVRFTRTERVPNAQDRITRWIATITYRYLNPPTGEKARLVDPIGFQVSDYRLDPETVPTGA